MIHFLVFSRSKKTFFNRYNWKIFENTKNLEDFSNNIKCKYIFGFSAQYKAEFTTENLSLRLYFCLHFFHSTTYFHVKRKIDKVNRPEKVTSKFFLRYVMRCKKRCENLNSQPLEKHERRLMTESI